MATKTAEATISHLCQTWHSKQTHCRQHAFQQQEVSSVQQTVEF